MTTATCPYLSLAQVSLRIPPTKGNRPVHPSTITRWITRGARSADGSIIKLEGCRFPGGWKVTEDALERFLDRLTTAALGDDAPIEDPAARMSPQRRRRYERAQREAKAIWG
jgi:hypothetical protein